MDSILATDGPDRRCRRDRAADGAAAPAIGATQPVDALARSHEYAIKVDQTLLADITNDLDFNQIPGLPGIPAEAIRRARKTPPTERVLLLITLKVIAAEDTADREQPRELPLISLSAIGIEGNATIETKEIMNFIKTQTGRPLDPKQIKEDIRALISSRRFLSVESRISESIEGPVLIFRVTEKPIQEKAP